MVEPARGFSPSQSAALGDSPAERWWRQWEAVDERSTQLPDLQAFLAPLGELNPIDLLGLIRIDQQQRWQRGERPRAESYFAPPSRIPATAELVVDVINSEVLLREDQGEQVTSAEYLARFPQYRSEVHKLFLVHEALRADDEGSDNELGLGDLGDPDDRKSDTDNDGAATLEFPRPDSSDRNPHDSYSTKLLPVSDVKPARRKPRAGALPAGTMIGEYRLLGRLGQGGMGVVYKAEHRTLKRHVALKMLSAGAAADAEILRRFRAEAEAVARIQHPGIIQIYEVGEHEGRVYLSLELAEGGSLAERLAAQLLSPREAAAMVESLAMAMHAAHERGIVHRDLKPANVLLSSSGAAKVTDFGLAKQMDGAVRQATTVDGLVLGTAYYMAPEQAAGQNQAIGPATDVYALGAVLYETLTGRPPLRGPNFLDTFEQIRSREPVPPSTLQPRTPRDLDTICLKCLQKDPARRYASAAALARDLGRFLAGEPIEARPVSRIERLVKWSRRRPALAALFAVSGVAIATVVVGSLLYSGWLKEALDLAERREADANAQTLLANERLDLAERSLFAAQLGQAALASRRDPEAGLRLLNDQDRTPLRLRDFTWRYYDRLCRWRQATLAKRPAGVRGMTLSPDGSTLATADAGGGVLIFPASEADRSPPREIGRRSGAVNCVAFDPSGELLASAGDGATVLIHRMRDGSQVTALVTPAASQRSKLGANSTTSDAQTGAEADELVEDELGPEPVSVNAVLFLSPTLLAVAGTDATIRLWDIGAEEVIETYSGHASSVFALAYSAETGLLASAGKDGTVRLWQRDSFSLPRVLPSQRAAVTCLDFAPGGRLLATGGVDRTVSIWDLDSGEAKPVAEKPPRVLSGHNELVSAVTFSPDGSLLASAGYDRTIRLWDVASGREETVLRGAAERLSGVLFLENNEEFVVAGLDGRVERCESATARAATVLPIHDRPLTCVAVSPDSRLIASGSYDRKVQIVEANTGKIVATLGEHGAWIAGVAFSRDSQRLVTSDTDGELRVWNTRDLSKPLTALAASAGGENVLAFAADDTLLMLDPANRRLQRWNLSATPPTFETLALRSKKLAEPTTLAIDAAGSRVAVGDSAGNVLLLDLARPGASPRDKQATSDARWFCRASERAITALAFSPDSRAMAAGSADGRATLWNVAEDTPIAQVGPPPTPAPLVTLQGYATAITGISFSPDGRTVATAARDGVARLWDPTSGQLRAALEGHSGEITALAFAKNNTYLTTAGSDGTVRLWWAK